MPRRHWNLNFSADRNDGRSPVAPPAAERSPWSLLVGYWLALVVGTHWPLPPEMMGLGESDKLLHFSAYSGLALLVCLNWALAPRHGLAATG